MPSYGKYNGTENNAGLMNICRITSFSPLWIGPKQQKSRYRSLQRRKKLRSIFIYFLYIRFSIYSQSTLYLWVPVHLMRAPPIDVLAAKTMFHLWLFTQPLKVTECSLHRYALNRLFAPFSLYFIVFFCYRQNALFSYRVLHAHAYILYTLF